MFSQWVFLSVLALAVPSFAWAEDAVSDLAKEQSKAEQGDKRGDELFAVGAGCVERSGHGRVCRV